MLTWGCRMSDRRREITGLKMLLGGPARGLCGVAVLIFGLIAAVPARAERFERLLLETIEETRAWSGHGVTQTKAEAIEYGDGTPLWRVCGHVASFGPICTVRGQSGPEPDEPTLFWNTVAPEAEVALARMLTNQGTFEATNPQFPGFSFVDCIDELVVSASPVAGQWAQVLPPPTEQPADLSGMLMLEVKPLSDRGLAMCHEREAA